MIVFLAVVFTSSCVYVCYSDRGLSAHGEKDLMNTVEFYEGF
jgi:hypothetical protein